MHTNQSASSMLPGVRPFPEVDNKAAIELCKVKVQLQNIRALLQMSERDLKMILAYAKHYLEVVGSKDR